MIYLDELLFKVTAYLNRIALYWKELCMVLGWLLCIWQIVVLILRHKLSAIEKCAWILFILSFNYLGVLGLRCLLQSVATYYTS